MPRTRARPALTPTSRQWSAPRGHSSAIVAVLAAFLVLAPAPAAASHFAILTPPNEAVVTGVVEVVASAKASDPTIKSVTFAWSRDGVAWNHLGTDATGPTWSTSWDTTSLNGPALLRAAADGAGETDVNRVVVDNAPPVLRLQVAHPAFSPNGDGRQDTATVRITAPEPVSVSVHVFDASGTERLAWSQDSTAELPVEFQWDGTSGGSQMQDGDYTIRIVATDRVGFSEQRSLQVTVDTVRPLGRWAGVRPHRASGMRPITLRFEAEDRPADLEATVEMRDPVGPVTAKKLVIRPGTHELRWLPRLPSGRALVPGLYRVRLSIVDGAGNIAPEEIRRLRIIRPMRGTMVRRVPAAGRKVAITIDDCHYPTAWARMLSILRRERVRATFFCPGDRMLLFPDLVRRTINEGHLLGSHGWNHSSMVGRGMAETRRQIARADATAWRLARASTAPYFRPPYGAFDKGVIAAAGSVGHPRVIMWDVNSYDTRRPGPAVITANAVRPAGPGSIILLHTIDQSAAALPGIIRGLRAKGLQPVTLAHLFRAGRT